MTHYRAAMKAADDASYAEKQSLNQTKTQELVTLGETFRSVGNLGHVVETRILSDRIRNQTAMALDPQTLTNKAVQGIHRNYALVFSEIEKRERARKLQIMNVMRSHLVDFKDKMQKEGQPDLAALAGDELAKIEQDEVYRMALAEKGNTAPIQNPRETAYTHTRPPPAPVVLPPTPTPFAPVLKKALLEVSVSKKILPKLAKNGDYDDQVQNTTFLVGVRSRELVKDYEKLTVKLWAFGRDVNSRNLYKILLMEDLPVDSLPRGRSVSLESKTVANLFDDNAFAKYGYKFYGYILEVRDAQGNVLYSSVSPSRLSADAEKIQALSEDQTFSL